MATENTTTNEKKVTVSQLKKSLTRSKSASDKAIAAAVSGISGGDTATGTGVGAVLDEVFGAESETTPGSET